MEKRLQVYYEEVYYQLVQVCLFGADCFIPQPACRLGREAGFAMTQRLKQCHIQSTVRWP